MHWNVATVYVLTGHPFNTRYSAIAFRTVKKTEPQEEMGLNLTVEGGNREQGVQETDTSSQQPERKALFHYNLNKIYLLEAFVFGLECDEYSVMLYFKRRNRQPWHE